MDEQRPTKATATTNTRSIEPSEHTLLIPNYVPSHNFSVMNIVFFSWNSLANSFYAKCVYRYAHLFHSASSHGRDMCSMSTNPNSMHVSVCELSVLAYLVTQFTSNSWHNFGRGTISCLKFNSIFSHTGQCVSCVFFIRYLSLSLSIAVSFNHNEF